MFGRAPLRWQSIQWTQTCITPRSAKRAAGAEAEPPAQGEAGASKQLLHHVTHGRDFWSDLDGTAAWLQPRAREAPVDAEKPTLAAGLGLDIVNGALHLLLLGMR